MLYSNGSRAERTKFAPKSCDVDRIGKHSFVLVVQLEVVVEEGHHVDFWAVLVVQLEDHLDVSIGNCKFVTAFFKVFDDDLNHVVVALLNSVRERSFTKRIYRMFKADLPTEYKFSSSRSF